MHRSGSVLSCGALLFLFLQAPSVATAQVDLQALQEGITFSVRGGVFQPRFDGQVFEFMEERLGLTSRDFQGASAGLEVGGRVGARVQWSLGTDVSGTRVVSASGPAGGEQRTSLSTGPSAYLGLWVDLLPGAAVQAEGSWALLLGGGGGILPYRLSQSGDFPDASRPGSTLDGRFSTRGAGGVWFAGAALHRSLGRRVGTFVDLRYQLAEASARGDFHAFDPVDLSGFKGSMGLSLRR